MNNLAEEHSFQLTDSVTSSRLFVICLLISLLIHLCIIIYVYYQNKYCIDCQAIENQRKVNQPPMRVILQKMQKPVPEPVSEIITATVAETKITPLPVVVLQETEPEQNTVPQALDYSQISLSIDNLLEQDNQQITQAWLDECDAIRKKTGEVDCVPTVERLGLKTDDRYKLAKIFTVLDKNLLSKDKQRILKKLLTEEATVISILESDTIDSQTRALFNDELAYLRYELIYQDCDGSPNSGNCAGEVNILKLANLLFTLFGK